MEEAEQQHHLSQVSNRSHTSDVHIHDEPSGFEGFTASFWEERRLPEAHSEGLYGTL